MDFIQWTSMWEIEDAFTNFHWSWPVKNKPPVISVSGTYWEFDEHIEEDTHLFLEVDNEMLDEPRDFELKIHLAHSESDQGGWLRYIPDNHRDYGQGTLEINFNVGELEFALFADVFDEDHKGYGTGVVQRATVDFYEQTQAMDNAPAIAPISHVDVGGKKKIEIVEFWAFKRDPEEKM
jgi:hypothetical protein